MWHTAWRRPPPREPARQAPVSAAHAMLAAEKFSDLPFGGYAGEMVAAAPVAAPPAPQPTRLEIDPPPWAGREGDLALAPVDAPAASDELSALDALKVSEGGWDPPPPDLGPPVVVEPLIRPALPPPDWRREELERERSEQAERIPVDEPAKSLETLPAPKRAASATPNLDAWKRWNT